jgi:hypothetical protein
MSLIDGHYKCHACGASGGEPGAGCTDPAAVQAEGDCRVLAEGARQGARAGDSE